MPIFWALFDQQGSRWVFQATRMDGDIGFYRIKPDQMQIVNPLFTMSLIPMFQLFFYPALNWIGIRRPSQKMTVGGFLAGISFIFAMLVELKIEDSAPDAQVSILWQIPQYISMSLGEVLLAITGMEFAFTQAPNTMKSAVFAWWQVCFCVPIVERDNL